MTAKRHPMSIRLDAAQYEWLRCVSFERRIPMQKIIEDALDLLQNTPAWLEGIEDDPSADGLDDQARWTADQQRRARGSMAALVNAGEIVIREDLRAEAEGWEGR